MTVEAVSPVGTTDGVKPYSDDPVIVGPAGAGFDGALRSAVATAPTQTQAVRTLAPSSTLGAMVGTSGIVTPLTVATINRPGSLSALGAFPGTGVPASAPTPGSTSTSTTVPDTLRAYGNGRIPAEVMTPIGISSHRLWGPAATAFMTMRAAAAAEGVDIGVTDSYRSYEQQVELAARKGLYKNGGYAAVPGTSQHGWGLAVDVDVDPAGLAWMRANAGRFGYVEAVPREPWHWEYHG